MTITINGTTGITNDGGYTGDGVVFADTTPANTLVTTTGGNVGMGTSSPQSSAKLHVYAAGDYTDESAPFTIGSAATGDMRIYAGVNNTSDYTYIGSVRSGQAYSSLVLQPNGGNLLVGTTSANFSISSQTMAGAGFANSGFLTIGRTDYCVALQRNGSDGVIQYFFRGNSGVGSISVTSTATTYATSSDYRLKEDIAPMTGALDRVIQLKPCTYKWKSDGSDGQGFIAHELQAVVPECVTGEKDAVDAEGNPVYQGIDTSFLIATLTAAIQEQQAIILAQESALNALTARVAALDASLDARLTSLEGTQP